MKYFKILSVVVAGLLITTACDDSKMEWEIRDPNSQITPGEIPLKLAEKIARYDVLKSYTDIKLGVGIDMPTYMENETYARLVNENFDEVVVGYHMKHGAMVSSSGTINFTNVDNFMQRAKEAGLSIYGHTLVWHQNQNASYLNSIIAPQVVPGPAGSNILDISGLKDGSFAAWNRANPGEGISVVDGEGLSSNAKAVKLVAGTGTNPWSLQLITPNIPAVDGHTYEVSFWIRSEQPGKGRISFGGLANNYPWKDWMATGSATEAFTTTSVWQQVKFTVNDFTGTTFTMAFDLGYNPNVTYYIDVDNLMVIDLDAAPSEVNYVVNGGFESGDLSNWAANNPGAGIEVTGTEAFVGSYSVKMTSSASSANAWDLQLRSDDIIVAPGKNYILTFNLKADKAGRGRVSFPGLSNEWPWKDWTGTGASEYFGVTTSWQQYTANLDALAFADGKNSFKLSFDLGYLPDVTYYLDNIKIVEVAPAGAPRLKSVTIIEKSDEEKAQIIGEAMETWISAMMTRYKDDVKAWDVVNEPMLDNGTLRTGNVAEPANDEFYWVKYLGKDFAVDAFKLARQYGNPGDKLFINDYNLEHSLAKCDGLIEYVEYIESKGATIDGIGTQMHITVSTNRDNIVQMFQKLAATGKLIKVSELDVQVGTTTPSAEQLMAQAEMYKFVVDKYKELIPAAQQFGITVWGVNDPNGEGHWLPDDSACLWNNKFERKVAYKFFADGLAGRDVSEDFTGEEYY